MSMLPLLTEADPVTSAEGSIDPLGTYAIANSLALRLVPGVRERQSHPRFLTVIAVSLSICDELGEDAVADDGTTEPWQVFEWYLVEGMVRSLSDADQLRGLPGRDKAARALHDGVPLSSGRYLKAPSVFGFHGVYRQLSRNIGIESAGRLGGLGYDLITIWAEEQDLRGFCGSVEGNGKSRRRSLVDAIGDGMKRGATSRTDGWSGWRFFGDHLAHLCPGRKEASVIQKGLMDPGAGHRREVLAFLISEEGRNMWVETESERRFHQELQSRCSSSLRGLLDAISAYEDFARLLQDAFDDCIFCMSQTRARTRPKDLSSLPGVKRAAERVPRLFGQLMEALTAFGETIRFQDSFRDLAERVSVGEWLQLLLEHHRKVQLLKPPNGKAPWFERYDDGSCIIRPMYASHVRGNGGQEYVHGYRTSPLWSFAQDLRLVR